MIKIYISCDALRESGYFVPGSYPLSEYPVYVDKIWVWDCEPHFGDLHSNSCKVKLIDI